jgi:heptosyltransferase-2
MPQAPRVVVVRFGSVGDVVLTTPLLSALRRRHPDARVTVVTRSRYAELLETHPAVDRVMRWEPGESIPRLARRLREDRFDFGLDLQRSLRSRWLRAQLPTRWGLARAERVARLGLVWFGRRPRRPLDVTRRYFAAALALGVEPTGERPEIVLTDGDRAQARSVAPEGCVALAPGARWASKRWPRDHWRDLAERLSLGGRLVVALGLAEERALLDEPPVIAAYGLSLRVTAAVLERARVLVAHDSGLMHLAVAVGTPVVAMFGPTVRAQGFVPEGAAVRVVERTLACRPCSPFGSTHCPLGHHRCMREIEPREVASIVENMVGKFAAAVDPEANGKEAA